jgi:hypothetical protein
MQSCQWRDYLLICRSGVVGMGAPTSSDRAENALQDAAKASQCILSQRLCLPCEMRRPGICHNAGLANSQLRRRAAVQWLQCHPPRNRHAYDNRERR